MTMKDFWKLGHGFPAATVFFGSGVLAGAVYRLPIVPTILSEEALSALAAFVGAAVAVGGSAWVWRWQQTQEIAQMSLAIEQAVQPFVDELISACSLVRRLPLHAQAAGVDAICADDVHATDNALANAELARALSLRRLGHFHAVAHRLGSVKAAQFYSIETHIEEMKVKIQAAKRMERHYGGPKGLTLVYGIRPTKEISALEREAAALSMSLGILST